MRRQQLACVLGEIDLVTALGLAGIRSALVGKPGLPAWYSRYVARRIDWVDPALAPEALVDRLLDFAARQEAPPVLYYDGDWDLLVVSRFRQELGEGFRFVVAGEELVESLVDKGRFHELAPSLGLPVPKAAAFSIVGQEPPASALSFPLVAKPFTRRMDLWRPLADAKAIPVRDEEGLREVWSRLEGRSVGVILQEVVPGPESRLESYHAYVDDSGEIVGEFTGRKLRTLPVAYGFSTALEVTQIDDVLDLGRDLVRRLGLTGVAKLDLKRDDEGSLWLLEVNARFNLWHHPGARAGVNIPALVHADLTGRPRPATRAVARTVRWCSLAHDYQAAREAGLPRLRWAWWTLRCEAKSGFSLRDPFPLAGAATWRIARRVRQGVRRATSLLPVGRAG